MVSPSRIMEVRNVTMEVKKGLEEQNSLASVQHMNQRHKHGLGFNSQEWLLWK